MTATVRFDKWENTASTKSVTMDQIAGGSGLVPIIPSSVEAITSGTVSVGANGLVAFSGTQGIRLNGVFPTDYKSFRIVMTPAHSSTEVLRMRWRQNLTDYLSANYYGATTAVSYNSGSGTSQQYNGNTFGFAGYFGPNSGNITTLDMYPTNTYSAYLISSFSADPAWSGQGGYHASTAAARPDGVSFFPGIGGVTLSGTMTVYGYR